MTVDYFEELLKKPSVFLDESKLDINFVPERLPHRDKELSLLSQLFLTLLTNPSTISRKILITGKTGIGKTVAVKKFGELLIEAAKKRSISIKYIHVNCRKERTSYKVLIKIIQSFYQNFPKRGYSPQDLFDTLNEFLNSQEVHMIIVLDEMSYLIDQDSDLVYSLTRMNEDSLNAPQRLSIIGIVRDISCLNNLDVSTLSTLQRNIIKFSDYSKEQIFNILKYRAELSLKKNVISNKLIEMVSIIVYKNGDIRYGLNILWRACKIAESKDCNYITPEMIRLGNQETMPFLTHDILENMQIQKLIFLLAIVLELKGCKDPRISVSEILKSYATLCENTGISSRSYTQLWNYLQEFKKENIISIQVESENIRGRRSLIEISDIPLLIFENIITSVLNSKGLKI